MGEVGWVGAEWGIFRDRGFRRSDDYNKKPIWGIVVEHAILKAFVANALRNTVFSMRSTEGGLGKPRFS